MTQIKIHTIDNSGRGVDIFSSRIKSVIRTVTFSQELSDDDWLIQIVDNHYLMTVGDSLKLSKIIELIISFYGLEVKYLQLYHQLAPLLDWISQWYANECDGYWEHIYGVRGEIDEKGQLHLVIDLDETIWQDEDFQEESNCRKEEYKFIIDCECQEIITCLTIFKEWIEGMQTRN